MTISNQLASVEEVESAFLYDLVDALTATRTEQAVRATMDAWKDRVHAAGLEPDALLETFKRGPSSVHPTHVATERWANASKRELVLVCISLYARGRESS